MTQKEFIDKWSDNGTRTGFLMSADLHRVISAAVAAEHRATLEQCAKVADKFDAPSDPRNDEEQAAHSIAAAIRALP